MHLLCVHAYISCVYVHIKSPEGNLSELESNMEDEYITYKCNTRMYHVYMYESILLAHAYMSHVQRGP